MLHLTDDIKGFAVPVGTFAGLIGCDFRGRTFADVVQVLAALLDSYEQAMRQSTLTEWQAAISAADFTLHVNRFADTVKLTLVRDSATIDAEALLASLVRDLLPVLKPAEIQWLDKDTTIGVALFQDILGGVAPRRVDNAPPVRQRPPDLRRLDMSCCTRPARPVTLSSGLPEENLLRYHFRPYPTQEELVTEFGPIAENKFEEEPDPLRLSSWAIIGVLTLLVFPVGVTLAYINLKKGENLRVNTHVLVFTVVLLLLTTTGVLATLLALK